MFGLLVPRRQIERILNGTDSCDRRQFSTSKRGRVALIDAETKDILGFADLKEVRQCAYTDYRRQQGSGYMTGDLWASHRPYFEFVFGNVTRIAKPVSVCQYGDDGIWCELPDRIERGQMQSSLFDF